MCCKPAATADGAVYQDDPGSNWRLIRAHPGLHPPAPPLPPAQPLPPPAPPSLPAPRVDWESSPLSPAPPRPPLSPQLPLQVSLVGDGQKACAAGEHWWRNEDWDANDVVQCARKVRESAFPHSAMGCDPNVVRFPRRDWSTDWGCMCCKRPTEGGPSYVDNTDASNWHLFAILPALTPAPSPPAVVDRPLPWADAWTALTASVSAPVDFGSSSASSLVIHGTRAFAVLQSELGETVVGVGCAEVTPTGPRGPSRRVGSGCALVLGHEVQLQEAVAGSGGTAALLFSAISWLGGGADPVVGCARELSEVHAALVAGIGAARMRTFGPGARAGLLEEQLRHVDVYVLIAHEGWSDQEVAALRGFAARGGGLVLASLGQHGRAAAIASRPVAERVANRILQGMGLLVSGSGARSGTFPLPSAPPSWETHATYALSAITDHVRGDRTLSDAALNAALSTARASASLAFEPFLSRFDGFVASMPQPTLATPAVPGSVAYAVAEISQTRTQSLEPERLRAHPAAEDFPGVPPAEAKLAGAVERQIDGTYSPGYDTGYIYSGAGRAAMRSTGLYAGPGELLTVHIPERAVAAGLQLLIGCHTDNVNAYEEKDPLKRSIVVTRTFALTAPSTRAANAFGGLLYVTVPRGATLGPLTVTFSGGVYRALTFYHPTDTNADWAAKLAQPVAPWAEFVSEKIILSVPTAGARRVADASALMALWDAQMDHAADLEGAPHARRRPERFVLDRQISIGWMHSGYPLMGHVDGSVDDLLYLRQGGGGGDHWGPFHELGHNFQYGPWVLPGTTETTCNLWSVYLYEQIGVDRTDNNNLKPARRQQYIDDYLATGPDFSKWAVWTALVTYMQLQEGFGWDLFTTVFTQYRAMLPDDRPTSTSAKRDEWVRRTSLVAGYNLWPFYAAWGFPTPAQTVLDEVSALPAWTADPMAGVGRRRRAEARRRAPDEGSAAAEVEGDGAARTVNHEVGGGLIAWSSHVHS